MKIGLCRMLSMGVLCLGLSACGGGGDPVTGVAIPGLKYTGAPSVLTVELTGNALDNVIKVYANNSRCIESPVLSATARQATCIVTVPANLQLPITVTSSSDYVVYSGTLSVPKPKVTFKTTSGDFVMELDPTRAPITVNNFLSYVNKSPSFYNGTIFHRVISGFVAQGGGYTTGMVAKSGAAAAITLETTQATGLSNNRGSVAMARQTGPDTATSQFFINLVDNSSLNYSSAASPGYAVFGRVISGMDVIDSMATQPLKATGDHVPLTDITVTSATQTQ